MLTRKVSARHEIQVATFPARVVVLVALHKETGITRTPDEKIEFHIIGCRHDTFSLIGCPAAAPKVTAAGLHDRGGRMPRSHLMWPADAMEEHRPAYDRAAMVVDAITNCYFLPKFCRHRS